jgi:uncharacterized delta-60 repeat protein
MVGNRTTVTENRVITAKFTANGLLDTSFSEDGLYSDNEMGSETVQVTAAGFYADGRIAVAGRQDGEIFAGITDADGNGAEWGSTGDAGTNCSLQALAINAGQLVSAAGYCNGTKVTPTVAQYQAAPSSPGTGFGIAGGGGLSGGQAVFNAVVARSDGRVLAAGYRTLASGTEDVFVLGYKSNGTLDTSIADGSNGLAGATQNFYGHPSVANAVALAPDGKIVVAGSAYFDGSGRHAAILRLNPNGSLDSTFGDGGKLLPALGSGGSLFNGVAVQPNGKVVAVGYADGPQPLVMRFTSSGQPDETFAPGGGRIGLSGITTGDSYGVTVAPDGKILIGHHLAIGGQNFLAVTRLLGGEVPVSAATPTAKFSSPSKSKLKAKKFKSLAGSATDATKVEIAIVKTDKTLLKKKKRCLQMKNSKAALKKVKAVKSKCQPSVWLGASGTSSWSFKLKKTLKPGKYTLYVRAIGPGGTSAIAKKNLKLTW